MTIQIRADVTVAGDQTPPTQPPIQGVLSLDIIPESRRRIWNPGIYGGIPEDSTVNGPNGVGGATQFGPTLSPSGGDDTSAINTALAGAASAATRSNRRVVKLGSGTFQISSPINVPSNVVLRGTITGNNQRQTTLKSIDNSQRPVVVITGSQNDFNWPIIKDVVGTLKPGDTTITLNDVAGLNVGDVVKLDHYSDGNRSGNNGVITWNGTLAFSANVTRNWTDNPTATDACVFGNSSLAFNRCDRDSVNYAFQDFPDSDPDPTVDGGTNTDRGWRHMSENHEILAINGNTITIAQPYTKTSQESDADVAGSPIKMWYYKSPQVYPINGDGVLKTYAGLEDLIVVPNGTTSGNPGGQCILLDHCAFCWLKNVETDGDPNSTTPYRFKGRHIDLNAHTYRCEVRSCYCHEQFDYFPGGAYGINIAGSEHYIHDNVSIFHNKPINLEASNGGNVIAYNYVDGAIINTQNSQSLPQDNPNWNESGIGAHNAFAHSELIEGNITPNVTFDSTHGNNGFNVIFRNYMRGRNTLAAGIGGPQHYVGLGSSGTNRGFWAGFMHWEHTCIGNVYYSPTFQAVRLFTSGHGTNDFTWTSFDSIYTLGHDGWTQDGVGTNAVDDNFTLGNFYRHLEYYYVTDGNAGLYADVGNPEQVIPSSFHRPNAPSYFAGYTWPPHNPAGASFAERVTLLPAEDRLNNGSM